MIDEAHFRKLERMYLAAPINEFYAPTIRISEGYAELRMIVHRRLFHAANAVHGSVYFKALDDAAFFAVNSLVPDVFVLTVSFTIHLLRPVSEGEIRSIGRTVFRGRRLFVAEAQLVDAAGDELARGTGTFMPSAIPLAAEIGYAHP